MTFKVGDKVKFLNDVGGGVITKIKQQTAYVKTNDGFEIPTLFSELIVIDEAGFGGMKPQAVVSVKLQQKIIEEAVDVYIEDESSETVSTEDDEIITTENSTLNVILALVPIKTKGQLEPTFDAYLISDCAYRLMYTFSVVKDNFVHGKKAGLVEEDTKMRITAFNMSELKNLQSFKINCIFYKKGVYLPHEPLIYEYKIDALSMVDPSCWEENDFFNEKAIIVNITEMSLIYEIERMVTESEDKFIIQKIRKDAKPALKKAKVTAPANVDIEEVDLHIEELIDNHSNMTPGEIMDLQMSRFTIALDGAIRNNVKKIVFIHGVGAGKLKYEITRVLNSKYSKYRYQDASFQEYGFGATMVILKK